MENNVNVYLFIITLLMSFYCAIMMYHSSSFTPVTSGIPNVEQPPSDLPILAKRNVYETEDTRIENPFIPPVNPIAKNAELLNTLGSSPDLYSNQGYDSNYYTLDTPPNNNVNQLVYSGGNTKLLKIPLQYNDPTNEQLRSQDILITPYNKIKYNC